MARLEPKTQVELTTGRIITVAETGGEIEALRRLPLGIRLTEVYLTHGGRDRVKREVNIAAGRIVSHYPCRGQPNTE